MKDQVLRILKLVQEGRLSPEDALDLMDAFMDLENMGQEGSAPPRSEEKQETQSDPQDPFRRFVDNMERLTREKFTSIDWADIAESIRGAARKGAEAVRESVEGMSKGDLFGSWFSVDEQAECTLPLNLSPGSTLRVSAGTGSFKIRGGSSEASVFARAKVRGKSKDDAKARASSWTLVAEEEPAGVIIRRPTEIGDEHYEIDLPDGVNVELKLESGDIEVIDTRGSVRASSKSGDISCQGVKGAVEVRSGAGDVRIRDAETSSVEIESQTGDIRIERAKGTIKIRCASGDVRAKEIDSQNISIESVNGDIDLDLQSPLDGCLNVRSVYGDVLIDLAGGSNCRVSLASINGDVHCSAPLDEERKSEQHLTGRFGNGDGSIDVSAVSGDISFNLRDSG